MKILDWLESEMVLALFHLRYLTTEQIKRVWYRDRPASGCVKRLSRLGQDGYLARVRLLDSVWRAAWRIGNEGLRHLRETKSGEFPPTQPLSAAFIPHLLETNEIFVTLAGAEVVWDRMPFTWTGSHRLKLPFSRILLEHRPGIPERGIIRPDAMLVPREPRKPRVFIELDRSTECLAPKVGRNSIRRKLEAYRRLFMGKRLGASSYEDQFPDERPPRLVFVLSKRDARNKNPKLRHRRLQAITELTAEVGGFEQPVGCVYLDDPAALAEICGVPIPTNHQGEPLPEKPLELTRAELSLLRDFYTHYVGLWIRVRPESRVIAPAKLVGNSARELLTRLHPTQKPLPEIVRPQPLGGER